MQGVWALTSHPHANRVARLCLRYRIRLGSYENLSAKRNLMVHRSSFGGQRSIQLSYGCVAVHLADWRGVGNGPAGAGWARSKGPLRLPRRTAFWSVSGQLRLAGKA